MIRRILYALSMTLSISMIWHSSEIVMATGLFSIIFILMMDNLAEAIGEKK